MSQKTNAQRQADFRRRHFKSEDGKLDRLNLAISVSSKAQLRRLASCYGVTQRAMLERILADAENQVINSLPADRQGDYYETRLQVDVTQ